MSIEPCKFGMVIVIDDDVVSVQRQNAAVTFPTYVDARAFVRDAEFAAAIGASKMGGKYAAETCARAMGVSCFHVAKVTSFRSRQTWALRKVRKDFP